MEEDGVDRPIVGSWSFFFKFRNQITLLVHVGRTVRKRNGNPIAQVETRKTKQAMENLAPNGFYYIFLFNMSLRDSQ